MITTEQCYKIIEGLVKFPYPKVCVYYMALEILNTMEQNGIKFDPLLAKAVCNADDTTALELIKKVQV